MRRGGTIGAALALMMIWVGVTLLLVLGIMGMSIDEEWQGFWSDVGFNPYIALPYLLFSIVSGVPLFLLLRSLWNDSRKPSKESWPTGRAQAP